MPTVAIFGRLYNIRGDTTAERIRVLASYVDERMQQIDEQVGSGDDLRTAVLAALNIANDYYQTYKTLEEREGEIANQARELADILGDALDAENDDAVGPETSTAHES